MKNSFCIWSNIWLSGLERICVERLVGGRRGDNSGQLEALERAELYGVTVARNNHYLGQQVAVGDISQISTRGECGSYIVAALERRVLHELRVGAV